MMRMMERMKKMFFGLERERATKQKLDEGGGDQWQQR